MQETTSVSLGDHFESFTSHQIQARRFASATEAVRAGLRLLEERETMLGFLRRALQEGEASGSADYALSDLLAELPSPGPLPAGEGDVERATRDFHGNADGKGGSHGHRPVHPAQLGAGETRHLPDQVDRRFHALAELPSLGRSCDDLWSGYRRYAEGSHTIFSREAGGSIEIVRILHGRMDPDRHL